MAQFPGLLLWTDAWIADTKHLSRLERGTYHDLLVLMWRTPGCRVPNDDEWLARRLDMSLAEVAGELRPLIREFCQTDGNWIVQKRLQKEFVRAFKVGERMSVLRKRLKIQARGADTSRLTPVVRQPDLRKIESFNGRARARSGVDNSDTEPEEAPQGVADKKASEASRAELESLFVARRRKDNW